MTRRRIIIPPFTAPALSLFAATGATTTTFNPFDKSVNLDLSNGNLTVTENAVTANGDLVRSIAHYPTGVYYAESTVDVFNNAYAVGPLVCNSSAILTNAPGDSVNGLSYDSDGHIRGNAGAININTGVTFGQGDRIGVEVDCSGRTFRVRVNGGAWSVLADISFITGDLYYAVYCYNNVGNQITTNFGATAYVDTPPATAVNWGN